MPPSGTISTTAISAASSVMASVTAMATTASDSGKGPNSGEDNGECQLLGSFAIVIQGALGGLALLALVYKRWRERPQRPVKIWAFDVSKQVVGSILLHLANLLMSMLSSGQLDVSSAISGSQQGANPCSFYLLNLAIDTTIGIPILIFLLRLLTHAFSLTPLANPPESIQSGNYGQPPRATWWLKQCLIYFIGLLGMKLCVFIFFRLCPWIIVVGDWALRWTEGNEALQVFFVMLLFPVIMNALQYYIIDGFIKNQKPGDHEPIPSEDGEDGGHREGAGESDEGLGSDVEDEVEVVKKHNARRKGISPERSLGVTIDPDKIDEYDPSEDGDDSPNVGGSSSDSNSRKSEERSLLNKKKDSD